MWSYIQIWHLQCSLWLISSLSNHNGAHPQATQRWPASVSACSVCDKPSRSAGSTNMEPVHISLEQINQLAFQEHGPDQYRRGLDQLRAQHRSVVTAPTAVTALAAARNLG